ncbi:MAG TPA: alpha/beta fold hydrolase [Terriglobales bacterium]|nr:alpha/beta fold hydrolase [Terriglobales bacterium]
MPFVENRGAKIYWDQQGGGIPVLLIMGLGYPSDLWHRTRPMLCARYRTIVLDNRGVGRSDAPPGPYSMAMMAEDARAVLDAAVADRAHIFGVSMGGMIAQEFALQYPKRVRSLILGCTQAGGFHAVRAAPDVLMALLSRPNLTPDQAEEVFIPILYDPATSRERIEEDMVILRNWPPSPAAFVAQLQAIVAWEAYSRLPEIAAPTLVIHGASDRLIPSGNGELIATRIAKSKLVIIPRAGHMLATDQPEATHRALGEFLCQVDGTPGWDFSPPAEGRS